MMNWLYLHGVDLLLIALLAAVVGLIVRPMVRRKKAGQPPCCDGCSSCGACASCCMSRPKEQA